MKFRIPLPGKGEKAFRDKKKYSRQQNKMDFREELEARIEGKQHGTVYVVSVGEAFTVKILVSIRKIVEKAFTAGHLYFLFDVSKCRQVDSSALNLVTNLYKKLVAEDGKVGFLKPSKAVRQLLVSSGMEVFAGPYNSVDEFGASLFPNLSKKYKEPPSTGI